MKISTLLRPEFNAAFSNLLDGNISDLKPKIIYRLKKISNKFKEETETFDSARRSLCIEFASKNDNGEPITEKNKYVFTPQNQIIFDKKFAELQDTEIDIGNKIDFAEIEKIKLSVKDLIILEDIIEDPKE